MQQVLKDQKPDNHGLLIPPEGRGYLDFRASRECLGRALRIADTFLKEAERRGYRITTGTRNGTMITVDGETLGLRIGEKLNRVPAAQSYRAKMGRYYHSEGTGLIPSGVMRIIVSDPSYHRSTKTWEDGPKKGKIEGQLAAVLDGVISFAEDVKKRRIEHEEWRKRWEIEQEERRKLKEAEEQERQRLEMLRRKEEARRTKLHEDARLWEECKRMRAFVNAVEQGAREQGLSIEVESELGRWIAWAREYIESMEPLHNLDRYR